MAKLFEELLGNGDGTNGALQFTLKQSSLTYVTAATGNGTQSTLQVWVNNLQWHEVRTFLGWAHGSCFHHRGSPQGSRTVQFGDGTEGSRTPTGQMNIRAVIAKASERRQGLIANQFQALDRPQALRASQTPVRSGGADPATAATHATARH